MERYCNYIHGVCSYSDVECRTLITAVACRERREKKLKEIENENESEWVEATEGI